MSANKLKTLPKDTNEHPNGDTLSEEINEEIVELWNFLKTDKKKI